MAEFETLLYSVIDQVGTVMINRPERHNALSPQTMTELRSALAKAKADPEVKVVVVCGSGERAFCAGADLTQSFVGEELPGALELHYARGELADVFRDLWSLGKPVIAKVRGYALAGGFGLALACDFVFAADNAVFATPEIDRGLWPMMIGAILVRAMPPKVALDLMMTGRRVPAVEAEKIGFVHSVVPADELDTAVDNFVNVLKGKPSAILKLGKDAFYKTLDMNRDEALSYLLAILSVNVATEDAAEGIAAFTEKRDPQWKGR